uniref:GNAT family N-acetyltransferase n=1 Tax=Streptomyces sp. NBC_01393 TaxID=2903851 RepID=A0AAU3I8L1_9ACTN
MTAQPEQGQPHKPRAGESSTLDAVRLRRVNRWQAQGLGGGLADLYVDSRETSAAEAYRSRSRQDFLNRLTGDIRRPGFAMVIAETDHLVGCAFGFPVRSDGFWWTEFGGALPQSIEQLTVSGGVFAITSVLVQPHPQDQDVVCRLQERLLSDHQASLGATLVDQDDHPALTSLRSWGWLDVGEVWRPGPTMFHALVFPLGERTAVRLERLARDAWTRWPK